MSFEQELKDGYTYQGVSLRLGNVKRESDVYKDLPVSIPLKTLNRHGLIAGATGTGKTKTVQILCEELSAQGVPTLVMDIKGDLSGLAQSGDGENKHIIKRHGLLGTDYLPSGFPVELMTLSDEKQGVRARSTVTEFGPLLLSKIMGLNETQTSVMSLIFKFCDDRGLALLDFEDLKTVIRWLKEEGKEEIEDEYGSIHDATLGTMMRKIIMLEQQGAEQLFGEPSFDVFDLVKRDDQGRGTINIMRVMDMQSKPHLFSTFMLGLLAELYETFPESGDKDKPNLVMVIDEAHLLFKEANEVLLDRLETTVKLIRSKGIGLFFCTQLPDDIPAPILSQLGCKVQHALRGFTERDRKAIKTAVENYPISDYYDTDQLIMELGIGEALVTCLNEDGIPTPLAYTYMQAPKSRMDVLSDEEVTELTTGSLLVKKYAETIDRESAHEVLQGEIDQKRGLKKKGKSKEDSGITFDSIRKSKLAKSLAKEAGNALVRGALEVLGLKVDKRRTFF